MTKSESNRNLSVYLGQSNTGIGVSGESPLNGGGEQYLKAEGELHNTTLLKSIKNWLTLDSTTRDQQVLENKLEAWSYFISNEYFFTCRLASAGKHGVRISDFSHARAWKNTDVDRRHFDPAIYIGSSHDFEKPWRDDDSGERITSLSSTGELQKNILVATQDIKQRIINYLSYYLYTTLVGKTLIIVTEKDNFKTDSPLHKSICLIKILLPLLDKPSNVRIYTSDLVQYFSNEASLVVVPNNHQRTIQSSSAKDNLVLLNTEGDKLENQNITEDILTSTRDYAEHCIELFFKHGFYDPYFSYKSGKILQYDLKQGEAFSGSYFKILSNYSYDISIALKGNIEIKNAFLNILPKKYCNIEKTCNWKIYLTDKELAQFNIRGLLEFSLNDFQGLNSTSIQNRITDYLTNHNTELSQLLSSTANILSSEKYYNRVEELVISKHKFITGELINYIFSSGPPPSNLRHTVEKYIYFNIERELPNDLANLVGPLNNVISCNSEKNTLLAVFTEKLLNKLNLQSNLDILESGLESKKFNYLIAHIISDITDVSDTGLSAKEVDERLAVFNLVISKIDSDDKEQYFLQKSIFHFINKVTPSIIEKSPLSLLEAGVVLEETKSIEKQLELIWDYAFNVSKNDKQLFSYLLSSKFLNLKPEYLTKHLDSELINNNSLAISKNSNILNTFPPKKIIDLITNLDKYEASSLDTLLQLIDNHILSYNDHGIIKELLINEGWIAWRKYTKASLEKLHDYSLEALLLYSAEIKTIEVWNLLINDTKKISYTDITHYRNKCNKIHLFNDGYFSEIQFSDIVKLSDSFSVILEFLDQEKIDLDISIKIKIVSRNIKNSALFINTYLYERIKSNSFLPKKTSIDLTGIESLLKEENKRLVELTKNSLPVFLTHNLSFNDIPNTLDIATQYSLHENEEFTQKIENLILEYGEKEDTKLLYFDDFLSKNKNTYNSLKSTTKENPSLNKKLKSFKIHKPISSKSIFDSYENKITNDLLNNINIYYLTSEIFNQSISIKEKEILLLKIKDHDIIKNNYRYKNIFSVVQSELIKNNFIAEQENSNKVSDLCHYINKDSVSFLTRFNDNPDLMSKISRCLNERHMLSTDISDLPPLEVIIRFLLLPLKIETAIHFDKMYSQIKFSRVTKSTVHFLNLLSSLDRSTEKEKFLEISRLFINDVFKQQSDAFKESTLKNQMWRYAASQSMRNRSEFSKNSASSAYSSNPATADKKSDFFGKNGESL